MLARLRRSDRCDVPDHWTPGLSCQIPQLGGDRVPICHSALRNSRALNRLRKSPNRRDFDEPR